MHHVSYVNTTHSEYVNISYVTLNESEKDCFDALCLQRQCRALGSSLDKPYAIKWELLTLSRRASAGVVIRTKM